MFSFFYTRVHCRSMHQFRYREKQLRAHSELQVDKAVIHECALCFSIFCMCCAVQTGQSHICTLIMCLEQLADGSTQICILSRIYSIMSPALVWFSIAKKIELFELNFLLIWFLCAYIIYSYNLSSCFSILTGISVAQHLILIRQRVQICCPHAALMSRC